MDGYREVLYKKYSIHKKSVNKRLIREDVIKNIRHVLNGFDHATFLHYVCLVGSVSRNVHHASSDVDIICVWKYVPCLESLKELKNILEHTLGTDVDLIVMKYVGLVVKREQREQNFFENDVYDAVSIIGDTPEDILFSKLVHKLV